MNTTDLAQYALEMSWSTKMTSAIIEKATTGEIKPSIEVGLMDSITSLNRGKISEEDIYIKFLSLLLKEKVSKPIQATATQLGHSAGIPNPLDAFEWGVLLLKECKDLGLYDLLQIDMEWYVKPNLALDKKTRQKLEKLQYLPPMQTIPIEWTDNYNGGWLFENKHLVLGSHFTKHSKALAYDVINKLQNIQWEIDTETYIAEKDDRNLNKKKFLRVMHEFIDKPFNFVWRYDSRGRSYSSGYDLNLQSNEYGKALISLYNKELITNKENMLIAIANHAGKGNCTWDERITWARGLVSMDEADILWKEPMLGRKALRAHTDMLEGNPSGYVMSLDATASGLQIMAALSGCMKTAELTNMSDPLIRYDIYTVVTDRINLKLGQIKSLPRSIVKQCCMTHFYNSTAIPKTLLSEGELEVFYEVLEGLLPGADDVMSAINSHWNSDADHHTWTLPDGHTAYVPVVVGTDVIYTDSDLGEIPLRYYSQLPSDNFRSLCPNIIHSIDGYIAREMIRRASFQLSHVHDCFVFSPDHLQEVSSMYREIMAEIASSNLLENILRQISGNINLVVTKHSNKVANSILNSSYMLS